MKKFFLLFFILPLGSCINNTENVSINYSTNFENIQSEATPTTVEKKQTVVVSKDECYNTLKPLLDKGIPKKPDINVTTNIDEALVKSLQEHRHYIKELTDKINSCYH